MITLKINTIEKHDISPYLYMQFMEPLGTCDPSVDAAWDFVENKWHQSVIDKVNELAPTMIRWGGCFASYYHWKEAIGPYKERTPMINYLWGGLYNNHVGTHEVIDFCKKVNADPLFVVNMESDGRMHWAYPPNGENRFGTAEEAAEWVDYCNNPDNKLRLSLGNKTPYNVKYWQIGNETSYCPTGYNADQCAKATIRFARAMRKADPSIKLIGWGDQSKTDTSWCKNERDRGCGYDRIPPPFRLGTPQLPASRNRLPQRLGKYLDASYECIQINGKHNIQNARRLRQQATCNDRGALCNPGAKPKRGAFILGSGRCLCKMSQRNHEKQRRA